MLDFSLAELALISVVALLVVDPKDVPSMVRTCGKWFRELRDVTEDVRANVRGLLEDSEIATLRDEIDEDMKEIASAPRYIEDENGKLQRVYDISDLQKEMPPSKRDENT